MNWQSDTGKAFRTSLIMHGVVFVLIVAGSVAHSYFDKPEVPPHVFELRGIKGQPRIGAPGRMAGDSKAERTDKPSTTSPLNLPKLDKRPAAPVAEEADAPEPAPVAKPTTKATDKAVKNAKPATKQTTKTTKKKAATAKAATTTKPQTMSYSDFAKQHKVSGKKSSKKSPTKKPAGGTKINTSAILKDMKNNLSWGDDGDGGGGIQGGSGVTAGEVDRLADYFMRVRALIDSNFTEPKDVVEQVSALVEFTILANGTVTGVGIVQSSGNADFDAAALSSVKRLGRLDPPPGNRAYTRKIEFQGKRGG
jgi:TonB family protein